MDYLAHLVVVVCLYSILAVSAELMYGQLRLLTLAQGAAYAVGAYTSAIVSVRYGGGGAIAFAAALFVGFIGGGAYALATARLRGDYWAIASFAIGVITVSALTNLQGLTNGPEGIKGIPSAMIGGVDLGTPRMFAPGAMAICGVVLLAVYAVLRSPFGRIARAVGEDERLVRASGRNPATFRVQMSAAAGGVAATAGSLYAFYTTYVSPDSFGPMESVLILAMVVLGGPGRLVGAVAGAATLVLLPECLRFVGVRAELAATSQQVCYGVLLMAIATYRPQGLLGRQAASR